MGPIEKTTYQEGRRGVNEQLLLTSVLQKIREGFLFIDLEGVIAVANDAAGLMTQKKPETLIGKRFWEVLPDEHFGFSLREALLYGLAHRQLFKSYPERELEISTFFLYDGPRHQHGLAVLLNDLSEKQKFQQTLTRIERMKEIGEMTTKITHEIRNPLGGIRGFAMLLSRGLKEMPHLQDMAVQITEATKTLERLVTTVLQYARPLQVELRTQDLATFLQKTARFIKADPAFPSTVHLFVHGVQEPQLVPFDPAALQSALLNLAVNGWQAMPHGGTLTLSLMRSDNQCQITVADTGIGMSAERLANLFEPLFTTKQNGNGLGLVETKKIVEAHGGRIDVRSTPQHGTSFTITLRRS